MNSAQELALFVENNQERFYRIAYTYVKSREDALDVIHDAIVKALQPYHTLRRPEYAKTWFYRILINECNSFLRKNRCLLSWEDGLAQQASENLFDIYKDEYIDLYAAVKKLSPDMKTVVVLRFLKK